MTGYLDFGVTNIDITLVGLRNSCAVLVLAGLNWPPKPAGAPPEVRGLTDFAGASSLGVGACNRPKRVMACSDPKRVMASTGPQAQF